MKQLNPLAAALLCIMVFMGIAAHAQQQQIELPKLEMTVGEIFSTMRQQGFTISHGNNVNLDQQVTLSSKVLTPDQLLKEIGSKAGFDFKRQGDKFIVFPRSRSGQGGQSNGKVTISGYVYDQTSKESLIGVTVFDTVNRTGTSTNLYGFFSYTAVPPVTLRIQSIGFGDTTITALSDQELSLELRPSASVLKAFEVTATQRQETQMSMVTLTPREIEQLPAFMGEPDIIKSLTLLPGISSGNDNSGGFYVRGGGPDQNLVLLDGANIYNSAHAFDLFSTINADAVKRVDLIKGGFPARYGGRLSSVMDIRLREGNMQKLTGEVGLGYLLSSGTIEGPIIKDKVSFLVSGRRTFLDAFSPLITLASSTEDQRLTQRIVFSDITAKINAKLGAKDRVYLSFYNSGDLFKVKETIKVEDDPGVSFEESFTAELKWANRVAAARWNHQFGDKLFLNTTATYSRFNIGISFESEQKGNASGTNFQTNLLTEFSSKIEDYGLQLQFDYYPTSRHSIKYGVGSVWHEFTPGVNTFEQSSSTSEQAIDTLFGDQKLNSLESYAFVEDEIKLSTRLSANVGIHAAGLLVEDEWYPSLQPRISMQYQVSEFWNLRASYAEMTQFIHLLTNSTLGIPLDLWVPATPDALPMQSRQVAIGSSWDIAQGWEFSTEAYYKRMTDLIAYKEGARFTDVQDPWQEKIVTGGTGEAYGAEFLLRKNRGKTTGWAGYTLSWTNRQFDQINGGDAFPYKYDRRHDASVVIMHAFNDRVSVSTSWVYATGNSATFPAATYQALGAFPELDPDLVAFSNNVDVPEYEGRNALRLPSYHRLDIGLNLVKEKKRGVRTWNFSVYNAYIRRNAFFVFVSTEDGYQRSFERFTQSSERKLRQVSAFWIVPSVTYNFKFH